MISSAEGKLLLGLAKEAVRTALFDERLSVPQEAKKFASPQGVFVTIHEHDQLRGCIGFPEAVFPLYDAVVRAARAAAFDDPRFPPIEPDEWPDLHFETSILTVPQKLEVKDPSEYPSKITIGKDGLILHVEGASGLLLPQVPVEWNWNPKQFLDHLCMKAGVVKDAWQREGAEIFTFQAQIFSDPR